MAKQLVSVKLDKAVIELMKKLKHPGQSYNGFILELMGDKGQKREDVHG